MANSVLLVSNFLSSRLAVRTVAEELALRLARTGRSVRTSSTCVSRIARLFDMATTTWFQRRQFDVAVVEVYSGAAFIWAEIVCWILRRAHKPYVLALHGGNLPSFAQKWPSRVRRLFQSATVVTVPSRYLLEQMHPYHCDLRLLPNALDIEKYDFRIRQQARPRLIWLRAFHQVYNPSLAVRVLKQLEHVYPDIHLTMIGPDKGDGSLQQLQSLADELGVSEKISLPGKVLKGEISDWMNKGDIFLNTTNVDNTPVSVLEAMACGLCVVSTNVGGIPYLLEHEKDALLVPSNEPVAMAEAVRRVVTQRGLAEQLSRNGRRKVEQFDWSAILPRWEAALTKAAVLEKKDA